MGQKCRCGREFDTDGHHIQNCTIRQRGAWSRAHNIVQNTWHEIARNANVTASVNPSDLPRPDNVMSDKHADIRFNIRHSGQSALIGDVSLTHPMNGQGRKLSQWGTYTPSRLQDRVNTKNLTYFDYHRRSNYDFIPLVATTYGKMCSDSIILCFVFAQMTTENLFNERMWAITDDNGGYTASFCRFHSRFYHRFTSRVSHSVCRGAGVRGTLGHVPPTTLPYPAAQSSPNREEDLPTWPSAAAA